MSRVFVASDRNLGRRVAIKVLSRDVSAEVKAERFRLEIQLAAKLSHPHIVPLLQWGDINGILYYTMPFVPGESLRAKIDRDGALPIPDAIRILRHVASAISYAHRHGVVHRDIKPDNVLIADEFALVTDFGISRALSASTSDGTDEPATRLTTSGMALGTPAYMAPEQALADPTIDHRADIYAFGILAYETLTGSPPFKAGTAQATLAAHVVQPPDPILSKRADIPPQLAEMVMKCIEKRPDDRPQTASELLPVLDSTSTPHSGELQKTDAIPPASRPAIAPAKRKRRWIPIAVAVAVIAIGGLVFTKMSSTANAGYTSIAVLPLQNQSDNKSDEYFSDGLTDELANALGRLPGLRVASRSSSYAFKGSTEQVETIGKKLHVQTVLEGTVRRDGNKLRIGATLSSVNDGLSLWTRSFDVEAGDIFKVQDSIAAQIAAQLKSKLGKSETQTLASDARGTQDTAAYENYLRGIYFLNRRGGDNLRLAVDYLDSAIAKDPRFARAYSAKAMSYALLPEYTDKAPKNVSALARESAQQALAIDSTQAEAYTALGLVNVHDWNFDDAGSAYRRALQLKPDYPTANQWYGELLFHTGKLDQSVKQIQKAVDLDPLAPINGSALGYALFVSGDYNRAIAEATKGIQVAPSLGLHHTMLSQSMLWAGRPREAIAEAELAVKYDPELALRRGQLANVYARAGRAADARRIVDSLEVVQKTRGGVPVAIATGLIGLKEYSKALDYLDIAVQNHDIALMTAQSLIPDPLYDPLRNDPRFQAILKKMNLWPYAQAFKLPKR